MATWTSRNPLSSRRTMADIVRDAIAAVPGGAVDPRALRDDIIDDRTAPPPPLPEVQDEELTQVPREQTAQARSYGDVRDRQAEKSEDAGRLRAVTAEGRFVSQFAEVVNRAVDRNLGVEAINQWLTSQNRQPLSQEGYDRVVASREAGAGVTFNPSEEFYRTWGRTPEEQRNLEYLRQRHGGDAGRTNAELQSAPGAALVSSLDPLQLPSIFDENYQRGRNEIAERHPVADFVGGMVGVGNKLPFPRSSRAIEALENEYLPLLSRSNLPAQMGSSAGYGGVYGFDSTPGNFEERLAGSVIPAGLAALLPPAIRVGIEGVGGVLSGRARAALDRWAAERETERGADRLSELEDVLRRDAQTAAVRGDIPPQVQEFSENRAIADHAAENNRDPTEVGREHITGVDPDLSADINRRIEENLDATTPPPPEAPTLRPDLTPPSPEPEATSPRTGFRRVLDPEYNSQEGWETFRDPTTSEVVDLTRNPDGHTTFIYTDEAATMTGQPLGHDGIYDPKTDTFHVIAGEQIPPEVQAAVRQAYEASRPRREGPTPPRGTTEETPPVEPIADAGGGSQQPPARPPEPPVGGEPPEPPRPDREPANQPPSDRRPFGEREGYSGNINISRIESGDELEDLLNAVSGKVGRRVQGHEATARSALDLINQHGDELYAHNPTVDELPAYALGIRLQEVKASRESLRIANEIIDGVDTQANIDRLQEAALISGALSERSIGIRGSAGRLLDQFRIVARSPETMKNLLDRVPGGVVGNRDNMLRLAQVIKEHADNPEGVASLLRDVTKPKASDYIFSAWYNWRLLSSVWTHVRNFMGNTANILYDIGADHGAASLLGQRRRWSESGDRVMVREVLQRLIGAGAGVRAAFTRDVRIPGSGMNPDGTPRMNTRVGAAWRTGSPLDFINRTERPVLYEGKGAQQFLEAPTRGIAWQDELFRNIAASSNFYGRAYRQAKLDALHDNTVDVRQRMQRYLAEPTADMLSDTAEYARRMRFQDAPGPLARHMEAARNIRSGDQIGTRMLKHALRTQVPFVGTPSSLFRTALRRTPLGALEGINLRDFKAGGARRDLALGRMAAGSSIMVALTGLVLDGTITGNGPTDRRRREELIASGWRPNTINGIPYSGLEPFSNQLNTIANYVETARDPNVSQKSLLDQAAALSLSMADSMLDSTWTENLSNLFQTVSQSEQSERATAGLTAMASNALSPIPGFVRDITRATDPVERDTTGDGSVTDRFLGRIQGEIPGLSRNLPARMDVYGRPRQRGRTPFSPMDEEQDPAALELQRLSTESGQRTPLVGPPPKALPAIRRDGRVVVPRRRLTAEEFQNYQHLSGQYILESVRAEQESPEWAWMDDDERRRTVRDIVKDMRANAREELFAEHVAPDDEEEDVIDTPENNVMPSEGSE